MVAEVATVVISLISWRRSIVVVMACLILAMRRGKIALGETVLLPALVPVQDLDSTMVQEEV
jgi:hypothetical protein